MYAIYNLVVSISWFFLKILAVFNTKIKLFVAGRTVSFKKLRSSLSKDDQVIWMHVASLGEFEQGLPIIEGLRAEYPSRKILLTFFSPSGYEIKKNTPAVDVVVYLPMDTRKNASRFLDIARPELAIFVKYEIWPNYLRALEKRKVPTLLVSAIFKDEQIYFKGYGGYMRKALRRFDHYFVQDEASQKLLGSIEIKNVTISGDTRLDRVSEILDADNHLDFMRAFKKDRLCFVAGSTWSEGESILIDYINHAPKNLKYVLAPHTIRKDKILGLAGAITKKKVLYSNIREHSAGIFSNIDGQPVGDCDVLIVDTIGLLTKIYSYADIAYVGGGFATGLHNTLEPAVFGIPVIIGPHFKGFKEAEDLVARKGIYPVADQWAFDEFMKKLLDDPEFRKRTGKINAEYIAKNKGASAQIMTYIRKLP
ncbi:glycosyltransferase N-terminal domain-containing protein [Pricia sp. S334]|uniref:3-deoxy-D-manno-octulosonic acid transferase n=1 Tax=Pricia mediterranea TaxID=3076079 RepID=A0ABU3L6W1_9FLAO|nr:glycosyltransferase N-terminal domain-containing protein [Pricia sp. S334]MDT7829432.1 glycosyltransferase N-terminal domain-containing protein [Pricia sp. S334]